MKTISVAVDTDAFVEVRAFSPVDAALVLTAPPARPGERPPRGYHITHRRSGLKIGPRLAKLVAARTFLAALEALSVDWSADLAVLAQRRAELEPEVYRLAKEAQGPRVTLNPARARARKAEPRVTVAEPPEGWDA